MRDKIRAAAIAALPVAAVVLTHLHYQKKIEKLALVFVDKAAQIAEASWNDGFKNGHQHGMQEQRMNEHFRKTESPE